MAIISNREKMLEMVKKMKIEKIIATLLLAVPLLSGCESSKTGYIGDNTPQTQVVSGKQEQKEEQDGYRCDYEQVQLKDVVNDRQKYAGRYIEVRGLPTDINPSDYDNLMRFSFSIRANTEDRIIPYEPRNDSKNWLVCIRKTCEIEGGLTAEAIVKTSHENDLEIVIKGCMDNAGRLNVNYVGGIGYFAEFQDQK